MSRLAPLLVLAALALACGGCAADPIAVAEDQRLPDSPILIDALAAGEPVLRARAAQAMGRIQSSTYAAPLLRVVDDADPQVRRAVLFALGQLALAEGPRLSRAVYVALSRALEDTDPEIVALALEAIGKLGEPPLAHVIHPFLHHPEVRVRVAAATALFRCRFVPTWRDGAASAPELADAPVSALALALADDAPAVRRAAAHACSRYGEPRAVSALLSRLEDADEEVRLFAARALGRSGEAAAVEPLLRCGGDPSPAVRAEALAAAAALGRAPELPSPLQTDASFQVRAALVRALGTVLSASAADALRAFESDPSPTVRAAATETLAAALGAAYLPALEAQLASPDWPARLAALRALGTIGPDARPLLEAALGDSDARVRAEALEALGHLGEGASPFVLEALASPDVALRGTAVSILAKSDFKDRVGLLRKVYLESAGDEWIEIRREIIDAVAPLDEGRALVRLAVETDPARAVRDRGLVAMRARKLTPPAPRLAAAEPSPFLARPGAEDPLVLLETTKGEIEIRVLARAAPVHAASFLRLVRQGFYDGLIWHRVVPNFVIQGGDPRGDGWGGPGYALRDEINLVRFERGTLGMPKSGPDSGGCQIFITHLPTPHLDGNYTAFGQVVLGLDVVDRIEVGDRIVRARPK